jgi:hypothetical protein
MTVPAPRPSAEDRIRAALWFAERGFGVFSVWSTTAGGACRCPLGASCDNAGKHPITTNGFKDATSDPARIRTLLSAGSDPNYGLVNPEGVFALDVDGEGVAKLADLEVLHGPLPATLRTVTAHGEHIFLRWPDELPRPIGQLFGFVTRWGSGSNAGYVIGPRSVHASGAVYTPGGNTFEIATVPAAWAAAVIERKATTPGTIVIAPGAYELPDKVPASDSRYEAIRTYTASLYNRGLTVDDMWPLVRERLAPRFELPLSEPDLRSRFNRVTEKLGERLGEPRLSGRADAVTIVPVGSLVDAPLTEFESEPINWLWYAWLPRGVVTLMDGNPGVSKSTLVADLVARITTGGGWPDGTPATRGPGRVMWITTEDDPGRVLRPRIEAAGGDASLVRFVTSEVVFPGASAAFAELLVRRSQEPEGLEFVILDPLFSHIDAKVKSIADADMRQGVMNPLNRAAEAANVSIMVVRHFNKDTAASAINRGAGSLGGIVGAARALWSVAVDPEDETGETKAVGVSKLNYARTKPALRYQVVDRLPPGWLTGSVSGIEWLGESAVSMTTLMAEVKGVGDAMAALEEILASGPVDATAAKNQMRSRGYGQDATKGACLRLAVVKKKAGMTGGWQWSLPEDVEEVGATPSTSSKELARAKSPLTHSFHTFEDVEEVGTGAPPAGARARDDVHVRVCHFYADHTTKHERRGDLFICTICDPEYGPKETA